MTTSMELTTTPGKSLESDSLDPARQPQQQQEAEVATSRGTLIKRTILVVLIVAVIVYVIVDSLTSRHIIQVLEDFIDWVRDAGALGPIVFALVYALATILFLPGIVLTLGAGFAFAQAFGQGLGVVVGSLVVFVGATAGAVAAFLLGRYALRDFVAKQAMKFRILAAIDRALEGQGLQMVVLLRLSPVIPFNAFNYFMGLTGVRFWHYLLGSFGMIPGTVAFVYFGSLISDIKNAVSGDTGDESPGLKWTIFVAGIAATVVAVILISVYAKRALDKHLVAEDANAKAAKAAEQQQVGDTSAAALAV